MFYIELKKDAIASKIRHQCSMCFSKKYENKMRYFYYPFLHRKAWHCNKCISKMSPRDDKKEN